MPRIYLAANSGARMGIAKEVLAVIRVAWEDDSDPEKGFKYLYLTPEDYLKLSSSSTGASGDVVRTELVHEGDENRYSCSLRS